MFSVDEMRVAYLNQLCLEFSETDREQAWRLSQNYSNDAARWNAYLNHLCLNVLIPWIQEESDSPIPPKVWPSREALPSIWEIVNGTVVTLGETRIALIPSEAIDRSEFGVLSEWVDLTSWAADYYLAVQVNPDDLWLQVWGFTTHSQLKSQGYYDRFDRSYTLEGDDLIENLNALWVSLELCSNEKAALAEIQSLSGKEAEDIVQELSQVSDRSPRLEVEFEKWAALLENHTYRQQLYDARLKQSQALVFNSGAKTFTQVSRSLVNLSQWFENMFEAGWQAFEEVLGTGQSNLAFSMRSGSPLREDDTNKEATIKASIEQAYNGKTEHQRKQAAERLGKIGSGDLKALGQLNEVIAALIHLIRTTNDEETRWTAAESLWTIDPGNRAAGVKRAIDLGMQLEGHSVALLVAILEKAGGNVAVLLRVYPMKNQVYLPSNLELVVLDEEGETFLDAVARSADNFIQLKFGGSRAERFSVRVGLGDAAIIEDFVI